VDEYSIRIVLLIRSDS